MNKRLLSVAIPLLLVGCGGGNKDAESPRQGDTAGDKVNQAAQDTKESAGNAAEEASDEAEQAGDKAERAGDKAKHESHDHD